jgi:hypothetical protein
MKLTVTRDGKLLGKRTTDRPYTHVVVLTKFNADAARREGARGWTTWGADACKKNIDYSRRMVKIGAGGTICVSSARSWSYQQSQGDYDRHVAWLDGMTDDQIMGREAAASFGRCEKGIIERLAEGDKVLSWHSTRALADKAMSAAIEKHPAYTLMIMPVDGQ